MRATILTLALVGLATLQAEEKRPAAAKVRVLGMLAGIKDVTGPGVKSYTGTFATKGLQIEVSTTDPLFEFDIRAKLANLTARNEIGEAMKKRAPRLFKDRARKPSDDLKELETLLEEFKLVKELWAEMDNRPESVCVAEGTLAVAGKKVTLTGTVRLTDFAKADKDLPIRGALVEGEAAPAGTAKTAFAIRNGDGLILVTGAAAGKERKGRVRVYGFLKLGDKGLTIDATRVEEVK